jgi:hypothetical protein
MYRQLTPQLFESIEIRCDDTLISGHIFTPKIQNPSTPSPGALHDFKFIGPLHQWPLLDHVTQTDQRQKWSKRVIKYTQQARDLEAETPSSQQEALGAVIPSPLRQLKKQIEQSQWVKPPPFTPERLQVI